MSKGKTYTLEMAKEVIQKYDDKSEFHRKNYRLYRYCKKMGWLDELSEILPRKKKWTIEKLKEEALKYQTRGDFMKGNISAYNVALNSGVYDEIVAHMGDKKKFEPQKKWDYETVKELYLSSISLKDLRKKHGQKVISSAMRNGWHDKLSTHFIKEDHENLKWTYDKVKEEALKYESRKEFGLNSPSAYQKALEMKWMDEISIHMSKGYTKWTKEKMMEIASQCSDMTELKKKSAALYIYIKRHKLENTIFQTN